MICGSLIASVPLVSRRGPAADVDRQDRGCVLIEDHSVAADAQAVAVACLKSLHVTLARQSVAMKAGFHPPPCLAGCDPGQGTSNSGLLRLVRCGLAMHL